MVVDRFFIWVAEATAEQKLRAVDALVAAYLDPRLDETEREAVEAALTLVADDPDLAVRRRLAEVLAEEVAAPRHLLLALLDDHPSIAVVVAGRSEALIDAELVDLVAHSTDEVRLAVAGRRRLGPGVAAALAEAGDRDVAIALLGNPGADIAAIVLERLVERFGEFAEVRGALLARPHVPITVRHRALEKLAEAMENLVVVRAWMGRDKAETVTREAREKATVALAGSAGAAELTVLADHLRRTGRLTTRLLLRAACVGHLRFVEEAFALLAQVPASRVAALVADGRESAILALYRRAGLPDRAWPAFFAAVEIHRELLAETGGLDGRPGDRARFSRRLVERVLTRFTAFDRRDADDLVVLLRRYAADAAREHVRHVVEERRTEATRALAAPASMAAVMTDAVPIADPSVVDDGLLDALAAELGLAAAEAVAEVPREVAPAPDFAALASSPPVLDDQEGGLFSHVRLEDLPQEWLAEDIDPEALWAAEEIAVRRAIVPDLRLEIEPESESAAAPPFELRGAPDEADGALAPTMEVSEPALDVVPPVVVPVRETIVAEIELSQPAIVEVAAPEPEPVAAAPAEPEDFIGGLEAALGAILARPSTRRAA